MAVVYRGAGRREAENLMMLRKPTLRLALVLVARLLAPECSDKNALAPACDTAPAGVRAAGAKPRR